jgi:ABC-type Fe3+ transport system permease subunit
MAGRPRMSLIRMIHTPALTTGLLAAFMAMAAPCAAEWRRIDSPN